jgi:aminoglycoside phosphotransferase (APT) family kinase protein
MSAPDEVIDIDGERLATWLRDELDPTITEPEVSRLAGGNSSGAWRLDVQTAAGPLALVIKAPSDAGLVFDCDASREGRILDAAQRAGAPVPSIAAIDTTGRALGRPCFVMGYVAGRGVPDSTPASFHGAGWFRDAEPDEQREVWESFVDRLAALHRVDVRGLDAARYGPNGLTDVLAYWRSALLDVAPSDVVGRQLSVLQWLDDHVPAGAEDNLALCMGDARLGNAVLDGTDVRALVDFEVAYVGHPAADIGYCLMSEAFTRLLSDRPAIGIPTADETWDRWSAVAGQPSDDRDYWTAFGATILCITATRAMVKWGFPVDSIDDDNLVVAEWEALVRRAT